jgi:hypothetical protein
MCVTILKPCCLFRVVVPAHFCPFWKNARILVVYALIRAQRLDIPASTHRLRLLAIQFVMKSLPNGVSPFVAA